VVSDLGAGGFGVVYRAEQLTTGQQVAIKVVRLVGTQDARALERRIARLEREMRLCAQLHHPNIVGVIDSGRSGDGGIYSVFEFVPGRNLEQVLEAEGPLDPLEIRHLMTEVLDALTCAHGQGVIHRDLKPSNIMVTSTGARRNALVLDFGIGALTDSAQGVDYSKITATNEVLGTIAYASPEQLLSKPTTAASDLYSWGLVFLECLTGEPAVKGTSLMDILLKQISEGPVTIPPALEQHSLGKLLAAVTAKNPDRRPSSTTEVLQMLEACDFSDLRRSPRISRPDAAEPAPAPRAETLRVEYAPRWDDAPRRDDVPRSTREPVGVSISPVSPLDPSTPHGARASTLEGERRQVTMLCVTLTVAAPGGGEPDIEEVDDLVHLGQDICTLIATRYRGHIVSGMGDQTLFRFGYPVAEEDDARRAGAAALAMAADIKQAAEESAKSGKAHLVAGIGIHTGLVVSRGQTAPSTQRVTPGVGATSKLAMWLSAAAAPGTVLISGDARRLLRNHFSFGPAATHELGKGGSITVFPLKSPVPIPSVGGADLGQGPLVGREGELEPLLLRWREARRGRGQTVLVTGELGIGKSRLLAELAVRIGEEPHRWLECRCVPEDQNSALHPFIALLDRMIDFGEERGPTSKRERLRSMLTKLDFDLAEVMPLFVNLLGLPSENGAGHTRHDVAPQRLKERTLNTLVALFFELSEREPVVLAVEDLQWADPTTLELLSMIVREVSSARMLAVFSARPDFQPPWTPAGVLQIQLGRLERPQILEMVSTLAGGVTPPRGVVDQIADRTDGIPLFVEELTRMMGASGLLRERKGDHRGTARPVTAEIPTTLRDLLMARLDRLGRAKGTAQIASVIGREFGLDLLSEVSPLDPTSLREDLDSLVAADLVQRKRRLKSQSYLFKHALIRETAYESMLRRVRQKAHADIARVLEDRFSDMVASRPDLLAHHLAASEQQARAIVYIVEAASGAFQQSAYAEAVGFAEQGLGWLAAVEPGPKHTELELQILDVRMPALMAMKGPGAPEVEAGNARAHALIEGIEDSPFTLPTLGRLTLFYQMRARFQESIATGRRCLALAERVGDAPARIVALSYLAQNLMATAVLHESREAAEQVLSLYDPEEHQDYCLRVLGLDGRVCSHGTLSLVLWMQGYPEEGLTHAKDALARAEEIHHANSIAWTRLYLLAIHHYRRDHGEVRATSARLHEVSERHGLYLGAFAAIMFGWLSHEVAVPEQILGGLRGYGQLFSLPYWTSTAAESDAAGGRPDAAIARLDACIEQAETTGEVYYLPELLRLKGMFILQRDGSAVAPAEACLRRATTLARASGSKTWELRAAVALGGILRSAGRSEEARDMLEPICREFPDGHDLADLVEARTLLDALSH
jgi:TOMM system kinase/cyclase fusion protein